MSFLGQSKMFSNLQFQTFDFFEGRVKACLLDVSFLDEAGLDFYLTQVSSFRREKCLKFKPFSSKCLSLGAGLDLDHLLLPLGLREKDCGYFLGPMEKPYFSSHPELLFNLSHSGKLALACLASRKEILELGCDVEEVCPQRLNVAKHCFHPDEYRYLSNLEDPKAQSEGFTRIWTLKESLLKATGKGLSLPMKDFCFDLSGQTLLFRYPEALYDYRFDEKIVDGYLIACCVGTELL